MKKTATLLVLADFIFILVLSFSSMFSGFFGNVVYYLAFLIPALVFVFFAKVDNFPSIPMKLKIAKENIVCTVSFLTPSLLAVFFVSWLTSLLLDNFGANTAIDVSGNIFYLIFLHAILPALLEEGFFRYLPLKYLAPYSKRYAILISSLCFSFAHCNLYQIPYAFVAGIIFAVIDIITDSILPSLLFHFLNNTLSLIWLKYISDEKAAVIFFAVFVFVSLLSMIPILLSGKMYIEKIKKIFCRDSERMPYVIFFFIAVALFISVLNFI